MGNYHWSTVKWVVNHHIRKYLLYAFQRSKHYLVMTLAFACRVPQINSSAPFYLQRKRVHFIINLCPVFNDPSAKCHTFIYHLSWLSIIHIFLVSSSPFHSIITTGMPSNAHKWRIFFKITSVSILWVNIIFSFKTQKNIWLFYVLICVRLLCGQH